MAVRAAAVVVVRVVGGAVSSRVVLKAVHRKPRANLRVVIQKLSQAVKAHGVAARGNRQGKGSADAARVNLLTRSNLEARS